VRENAYEDIRRGQFSLARRGLDRVLAANPPDARAYLYAGDLQRLQSQRGSDQLRSAALEQARAAYERALSLDPTLAEAHRQLGLLYYERKDLARARDAFRRYLAAAPGAPDARRIEEYLRELER
jgi:tetratricopeptide (TPR) repeat protein